MNWLLKPITLLTISVAAVVGVGLYAASQDIYRDKTHARWKITKPQTKDGQWSAVCLDWNTTYGPLLPSGSPQYMPQAPTREQLIQAIDAAANSAGY